MNIKNTCRICLRSSNTLYGLFDAITPDVKSTSSSVFAVWRTFVKILKNNDSTLELSDRICQNCRNEILGAYAFASKCERAKGICKQINKQVKVKLKKLKYMPKKHELSNQHRHRKNLLKQNSSIKKHQRTKNGLHIPLRDVQWAYGRLATTNSETSVEIIQDVVNTSHPVLSLADSEDLPPPVLIKEGGEVGGNGGSNFKCNTCDKSFALKISYNRHLKTHDGGKGAIECPICKATFSSHSVFEVHSFMHSITKRKPLLPAKIFDCTQCSRQFSGKTALNVHMRSHAVASKKRKAMFEYHCGSCEKVFASAKALTVHRLRHDKQQKCNLCSKMFATRLQLINHLANHKVMKPFVCDVCNKAFAEKESWVEHVKSHGRVKSYLCALCGKHLQNNNQYNQHMKEHVMEKQERESVPIRNGFDLEFRKMHLYQVQNPYACDMCDSRFPKHVELIRHRQVHTTDSSHVCEICDMRFTLAYALKLHMLIHSDVKQFDCGLCGESFEEETALEEHMQHHRGIMSSGSLPQEKTVEVPSSNQVSASKGELFSSGNSVVKNGEASNVGPVK